MGRHAAETDTSSLDLRHWTLPQIIVLAAIVLATIATALGIVLTWPAPAHQAPVAENFKTTFALNHEQVTGTVGEVRPGPCALPSAGTVFSDTPVIPTDGGYDCSHAFIDLTSGPEEGKRTLIVRHGIVGEPELAEGDEIMLARSPDAHYSFADYQRGVPLALWGVVFVLMLVIFARWQGVRAILGLVVTMWLLAAYLIPNLLHGANIMIVSTVVSSAILIVVIPLTHGINWKSASALLGTLLTLVIALPLAWWAIDSTQLRGLGSEDNLTAILYLPAVSVLGVMLCGFVIGAVGGVTDVAVAQASAVNEFVAAAPQESTWQVFRAAMRVGRDHISSMVYTLALSYTGAALPSMLLIAVASRPAGQVLTGDVIATELVRSGVGAIALILAVPLTTGIAAVVRKSTV